MRCFGKGETISDAIENRSLARFNRDPSIFEQCGHHLDVTHLASLVRIARCCTEESDLQLALDLSVYGDSLDPQLQYPGEFPFEDNYKAHRYYFESLLDSQPNSKIAYFQSQCSEANSEEEAWPAKRVVIDLYDRTGQSTAAVKEVIADEKFLESEVGLNQLIGLARTPQDFEMIAKFYRSKGDLLGYGLAMLGQQDSLSDTNR